MKTQTTPLPAAAIWAPVGSAIGVADGRTVEVAVGVGEGVALLVVVGVLLGVGVEAAGAHAAIAVMSRDSRLFLRRTRLIMSAEANSRLPSV
jgi:hypothetical protein